MENKIKNTHVGATHLRAKTIFKSQKDNNQTNNITYSHTAAAHNINNRKTKNENEQHLITEKSTFSSWMFNILNPINHLPIIGTIKKIHTKASESLDIVQSMIGGMIYGGPFGIIKGIGSWAATKLINKESIATKENKLPNNSSRNINETNLNLKKDIQQVLLKSSNLNTSNKLNKNIEISMNSKPKVIISKEKIKDSYSEKYNNDSIRIKISA